VAFIVAVASSSDFHLMLLTIVLSKLIELLTFTGTSLDFIAKAEPSSTIFVM
jgi:hypothetical protein